VIEHVAALLAGLLQDFPRPREIGHVVVEHAGLGLDVTHGPDGAVLIGPLGGLGLGGAAGAAKHDGGRDRRSPEHLHDPIPHRYARNRTMGATLGAWPGGDNWTLLIRSPWRRAQA